MSKTFVTGSAIALITTASVLVALLFVSAFESGPALAQTVDQIIVTATRREESVKKPPKGLITNSGSPGAKVGLAKKSEHFKIRNVKR